MNLEIAGSTVVLSFADADDKRIDAEVIHKDTAPDGPGYYWVVHSWEAMGGPFPDRVQAIAAVLDHFTP